MIPPPECLQVSDPEALDAALALLPDRPAVFLIHAPAGQPYLARTGLLRRRLKRLLGARVGAGRLLNLRGVASRIEYWLTGSRLESALIQHHLAAEYFPDSYLKLTKLRMPPFVKLIRSNPFPRTQVTSRLGGPGSVYYGPFRTRAGAEVFEAQLLDLFQIRRCQEDLAPSADHPGCMYGEMAMCLRPCQLVVGPEEYASEVDRVSSFFETAGRSLLDPLVTAREGFSNEMNFEEAARVHRRIEKVEQLLKLRDDLATTVDRLFGVAVTHSPAPGALRLWFNLQGLWQPPVEFGFEAPQGRPVSLDQRLREAVASLGAGTPATVRLRQEHIALLARWYYSSWRDGEWIPFPSLQEVPYRKLVRAVARVMARTPNAE